MRDPRSDIIEQIETCKLKATEYRVAMRLLHHADETGAVQLSRAECITLCQVTVWGAAARLLSKLTGEALIFWRSSWDKVTIHFLGWARLLGSGALRSENSMRSEIGEAARLFSPEPAKVEDTGSLLREATLPGAQALMGSGSFMADLTRQFGALMLDMTEMIRQNGAILASLMELTRQIGALTLANGAGCTESAHETRQFGVLEPPARYLEPELPSTARQNGAERAPILSETRQNGAFPHTCVQSVCPSDLPETSDLTLKLDGQTDLLTGDGAREATSTAVAMFSQENMLEPSAVQAQPCSTAAGSDCGEPCLMGSNPLDGVEPELAMGLLTSREVALPLKDARAVVVAHPFWRIRDCVFFYRNNRVAKGFRSPRIMLTWLARWDEFMILPTDAHDEQTDLYQRFLLPAERQAKAEEAARQATLEAEETAWRADAERAPKARFALGAPLADVLAREAPADEVVAHWQTVLADLALQMPSASYNTWVRDTWVHRIEPATELENETWVIGMPNLYARDWLNTRLRNKIERTLRSLVGHAISVRFEVLPRPMEAGS